MQQTNPSAQSAEMNRIAQVKLPLVVADYRTYFDAASRVEEMQRSLRQWEVSLLVALILLGGNLASTRAEPLIIGLIGILPFWLMDAECSVRRRAIAERARFVEQRLGGRTSEDFSRSIIDWEFGNSVMHSVRDQDVGFRGALREMISPKALLLFHGGLVVFLVMVVVLRRSA
jgi:hypothetical protein